MARLCFCERLRRGNGLVVFQTKKGIIGPPFAPFARAAAATHCAIDRDGAGRLFEIRPEACVRTPIQSNQCKA